MKQGLVVGGALCAALLSSVAAVAAEPAPSRTVLPVPPGPFAGTIGATFADSKPAYPEPVKAPAGAPNILLVLTDDVGFAASSTFGGPVPTPALDRLAANGLRYTRFHTTAMCTPTRASLLTGRNHHAVASGIVTDTASGYPGYNGAIPDSAATVADVLRHNGYNTAFFGKHHNTPQGEDDPNTGPFKHWPTGLGFEYFYGFIGGDTNQWRPHLYRGTTPVAMPKMDTTLDHYLAQDLIQWVHGQKAAAPDKPFLAYLAPGSAHAPHQVPPEWIARFKGQFDQGWDKLREESLTRQKAAGIVPKNTVLTPRPQGIPAWASLSPDERRYSAHMMEVYAGMLAYQDNQFGTVLDELQRMGQLDNTLVIFIEGDNGGSPEGEVHGTMNELGTLANGMKEDQAWMLDQMPKMGGPDSYAVYPVGWAWATNTPFQWTKQVGSHLGGTRNGMVLSWPARIKSKGEIRTQFAHVNDVMPTILEAVGVPAPDMVDGVKQQPMDGVSLSYSFANPRAPEQHRTQYFEMMGNRGVYHDGWWANTTPKRMPWGAGAYTAGDPADYQWELYDLTKDPAQSHNLAASNPKKLAEMQAIFDQEATRNKVYPLDDRMDLSRFAAASAQRKMRDRYTYWGSGISIPFLRAAPLLARGMSIEQEATGLGIT